MTSFTVEDHKVLVAKKAIIIFWGTEHADLSNLLDVFLIVGDHIITLLLLMHHFAPHTSSASPIGCCNAGMEINWLEKSSRKIIEDRFRISFWNEAVTMIPVDVWFIESCWHKSIQFITPPTRVKCFLCRDPILYAVHEQRYAGVVFG